MNVLALSLINNDGPSIRGIKGLDGQDDFWSVYDFINIVCGKPAKDEYGRYTFNRIAQKGGEHESEMKQLCLNLKFPGQGQRDTPTMTLRGLQRLLLILGGKVAADFRALVETTFTRVMAGDRSLIKVIEANAGSNAPIQQAFRAALEQDPSPGGGLADNALDNWAEKKRKRELEELELAERKLELEERKEALEHKRLEKHTQVIAGYQTLCPGNVLDDRARLLFKDTYLNLCMGGSQKVLTNGVDQDKPLTISTVATDLGLKLTSTQLQSVGCAVKAKYLAKYDEPPPKHEQFCNGAVRKVCSYTERDREMVEQALRNA